MFGHREFESRFYGWDDKGLKDVYGEVLAILRLKHEGHHCQGERRRRRYSEPSGMERQRMPRGDIKYILLSLIEESPQHGYQLIKELESRWGGFYRPSPGSVYPTLQLLEEGEYVTSSQVEGKKVYTITEKGRELLASERTSGRRTNESEEQPKLLELKFILRDITEVILQVARSGNKNRLDEVLNRLKQLKRDIYLMLAEDE